MAETSMGERLFEGESFYDGKVFGTEAMKVPPAKVVVVQSDTTSGNDDRLTDNVPEFVALALGHMIEERQRRAMDGVVT